MSKKKKKSGLAHRLLTRLYLKYGPRVFLITQVILVIASVTFITVLLEHAGWLHGFERAAMDAWLRANFELWPAAQSKEIVIVDITDEDYADIFQRKSPLNTAGIEQILAAIVSAKPALIGVDIVTADEEFAQLKYPPNVPIVWAEEASNESKHSAVTTVSPALGGAKSPSTLTGIAIMWMESDGVVRSFLRRHHSHDAFGWVVAKTYCGQIGQPTTKQPDPKVLERCQVIRETKDDAANEKELTLDLLGGKDRFQHVSVRELLDAVQWKRAETLDKLAGRAVLLGGTFSAGRDEYTTPLGRMFGVELTAHAIQSELHGPFQKPSEYTILALNLAGGIVILLLFIRFGVGRGCLLSLLAMILIAPLWSWIAFGSMSFVGYFAVILIALLIHQLYEQAHYIQHKYLHELQPEHHESETKPATKR